MPKGPKGEKRPADVIGAAVKVMQIATGEIEVTARSADTCTLPRQIDPEQADAGERNCQRSEGADKLPMPVAVGGNRHDRLHRRPAQRHPGAAVAPPGRRRFFGIPSHKFSLTRDSISNRPGFRV